MRIFGKSIKEAWRQISEELNADYNKGSFFIGPRIEYTHNNWTIYLDTYTVSTGKSSTTYTRMRVPFINLRKFKFKIYRKGVFSNIGKALGMQDIEIGFDDWFDKDFIIKGNDEVLLVKLLQNHQIRNLIDRQPDIVLEIKDDEGMFGPKFKENESLLSFLTIGVIKDIDRIKNLFELFVKVIDEFEITGITVNKTPEVKLYK
jgi:hypothetical protein